MKLLLQIHSDLRWLIVLVAAAALIRFLAGWLGKGTHGRFDRILAASFGGLLDLQAALGLFFLLWNGLVDGAGFPRHRLEHTALMIAAVVVVHLQSRWRNAADAVRFRNSSFLVMGALVLIALGVAILPGGWSR